MGILSTSSVCVLALAAVSGAVVVEGCSSGDQQLASCPTQRGSASTTAVFGACPIITSFSADPAQVSVGKSTTLTATAIPEAGTVTFSWTATSGKFANPAALDTTYTCLATGPVDLTLEVVNGPCQDIANIRVECVAASATADDAGAD
jgi:hypothetical protein